MEQSSLNLARKWRSKNFKEIVGQDLVVRILQNSLYKKSFFPVYLFSGQRGCGKTSTARVFAAALNCQALSEFQQNPKKQMLPCLTCESCVAMMHMRHPDFVEIDAASHTGVDNIRSIIDTSSFLPVMSSRKIYLIDEVHMLSKAAFNAFLKILEEPPRFVTFILATTEIQKVPDTVKSRCFQLLFNPIVFEQIEHHLEHMCKQERIECEKDALALIAQSSQGSLRDAVNLLEQARFAGEKVTRNLVCSVLGYVDDAFVYDVFVSLLEKKEETLMTLLSQVATKSFSVEYMIKRLLEVTYDVIKLQYQAIPGDHIPESVKIAVKQVDTSLLVQLLDTLCVVDQVSSKTSKRQLLLETSLLRFLFDQRSPQRVEKKNKQ